MRAEKDIRLRISLLDGQSSSISKMLANAIRDRNETAFAEYSEKLAVNRGKIEELMWILGEKAGRSVLGMRATGRSSVREVFGKLRSGDLRMDDLPADIQAMVRKGALEMKNARKQ